jgi:hypothetical protein
MSCKSRCANPERRTWVALALGALLARTVPAAPADPPSPALRLWLPGARWVGQATLRFWGLAVYDAWLGAEPPWAPTRIGQVPVVLELGYRRAFRGADIAQRSLIEMRRGGPIDAASERAWLDAMNALFPDVEAGERLAGLWQPAQGARFAHTGRNGRLRELGEVADAAFAERFFGIWLAPWTSEPALRAALLGLNPEERS